MDVDRKVLQHGVGALPTAAPDLFPKHLGCLGNGLYFSQDIEYVVPEYATPDADGKRTVLVAVAAFGNGYPVLAFETGDKLLETTDPASGKLFGVSIADPYDAHVAVVSQDTEFLPTPSDAWEDDAGEPVVFSELVVRDPSQVLPLAVLSVD